MTEPVHALDSTDAVIDALGGNAPVGRLLNVTHKAVSNWRVWGTGRFPAKTYLAISSALAKLGLKANPVLWGMIPADGEVETERAA